MKLIIGLGNPGSDYDKTRHNIGFNILDELTNGQKWSKNDYAEYLKADVDSQKVIFIKPLTFMNLSGNAVKYFFNYYKLNIEDILIIHDDLDIEVGSFKLKIDSSSGGHNGIESIINTLKTDAFLRLKIGISKPKNGDTVNYVLKKFSKSDQEKINKHQETFKNIIIDFITGETAENLMNKYNGKI